VFVAGWDVRRRKTELVIARDPYGPRSVAEWARQFDTKLK
jgi:hypothetical protein